jgi:hypothetical protein
MKKKSKASFLLVTGEEVSQTDCAAASDELFRASDLMIVIDLA